MTTNSLPGDHLAADNIRAAGPIDMAAMLQGVGLFRVADAATKHFLTGRLPIQRSGPAYRLFV